jgi:hypothetical protein
LLVMDDPDEFEKKPVEVQDVKTITNRVQRIHRIPHVLIKSNMNISTSKPVGLANTEASTNDTQKLSLHIR